VAPAASVRGNAGLTIVNPFPLTVPADTIVLAVPGFDIVTVWVAVDPTFTLPKNTAVGVTFSAPEAVVVVEPFPAKDSVVVGFEALDVNVTVPVRLPLAFGVKDIFRDWLLPGAIVIGNCPSGTANTALSTGAAEIIRFPPFDGPVFEIMTACVDVVLN
jgi:hypothetical protein